MKVNIIILFALLICNSSQAQTAQQSNVLDNFNRITEQVFDTYKVVNTYDNNHNLISYQIVLLGADLDITQVNYASTYIPAGEPFVAAISVKNNGNTGASNSILGVYLSNDAIYDANDILLQSSNTSAINSQSTILVGNISYIPVTTIPDNYFLILFTDYTNQVTEVNENNNYYVLPITVEYPMPPLPVELLFFTGTKTENGNLLNWETASETNNKGFNVQRSANGDNWETLGFVEGNGTTTETHQYDYLDKNPAIGKNYYRLEQVDFDGQISYSNTIVLENEAKKTITVNLFPTPTTTNSTVTLEVQGEAIGQVTYQIVEVSGRIVDNGQINHNSTFSNHQIQTPSETGVYILRLVDSEEKILDTIKFITY